MELNSFFEYLKSDRQKQAALAAIQDTEARLQAMVGLAAERGLKVTAAEIRAGLGQLSESDLDAVAGGRCLI